MRIILNFLMSYSTLPKREVIDFFVTHKNASFTLEEVSEALPAIGKSTVYRIVPKLVEEGGLRRAGSKGRSALYQYQDRIHCPHHMHVKCSVCGKTQHLDEETSRKIEKMVESTVGFEAFNSTVLDGICAECRVKEGK